MFVCLTIPDISRTIHFTHKYLLKRLQYGEKCQGEIVRNFRNNKMNQRGMNEIEKQMQRFYYWSS